MYSASCRRVSKPLRSKVSCLCAAGSGEGYQCSQTGGVGRAQQGGRGGWPRVVEAGEEGGWPRAAAGLAVCCWEAAGASHDSPRTLNVHN